MKNSDLVKILRYIGFLTEMEDEANSTFKARAYYRAAETIGHFPVNVKDVFSEKGLSGLLEIPSVGNAIAQKIGEYIKTGKVKHLEELKKKIPIEIDELSGLEGIGPKTIKIFYDKLKIKNFADLEAASKKGLLQTVPGFSEKREQDILKRIKFFKKVKGRHLIGEVYPFVKQIEIRLLQVPGVKKAIAVGSVRRMKETIGDIDYLVLSSEPEKVMEYFVSMPEVSEVLARGAAKAFVKLNNVIDADLLVVPEESFGSALQYFTGSKDHSVELRKLAISKGLRLNEWGVFMVRGTSNSSGDEDKEIKHGWREGQEERIAGSSEEEVYRSLGLDWIPPEMRESNGEIELAKSGRLPKLIEYDSLRGDLQVHSNSSDGTMPIEDMAFAAKKKFGLSYIAVTDHTKSLALAGGLDEGQLLEQASKIAQINDKLDRFRILSAAEVNILKDGSLDICDNVLDKLDIVGAAIHSNFAQPVEVQTERLVKAARNPSVDILFHPTGRIINKREGYPIDINKVIDVARDTDTILEIDAHYDRLDLKDDYVRMAVQNEVKLVIDSDAHHPVHYSFLMFGIAQARRGWAKKSDILNTLAVEELLAKLK